MEEEIKEQPLDNIVQNNEQSVQPVIQDVSLDDTYMLDALTDNAKDVNDNQKTIEYSRQTGKAVPDYYSDYKSTIIGTSTELDGQNVFDVANAKDATPKEIFNLWDTIVSIADGFRAAGVNIAEFGGELLTAAVDPAISALERKYGVNPEESRAAAKESFKKGLDYFGGTETMESKSYSGAIAGTLAQFYAGGMPLKGIQGAKIAKATMKTNAGRKLLSGFITTLKDMTIMGTSFDENQKNLSEFVESFFGISMPEFLTKDENDPDLIKRFKNSIDAPLAATIARGAWKLGKKVFAPRGVALEKAAKAAERAEDVAIRSGKMGEEFAQIAEENLSKRVKAFSQKQIGAVIEKAESDGLIPQGSLKGANRQVLENAVVKITQLNRTAVATGQSAQEALYKYSIGEMNEKNARETAINLWQNVLCTLKLVAQRTGVRCIVTYVLKDGAGMAEIERFAKLLLPYQNVVHEYLGTDRYPGRSEAVWCLFPSAYTSVVY